MRDQEDAAKHLIRADGVVRSASMPGLAGLTTPSLLQRRLRDILLDLASTLLCEPMRGGEWPLPITLV